MVLLAYPSFVFFYGLPTHGVLLNTNESTVDSEYTSVLQKWIQSGVSTPNAATKLHKSDKRCVELSNRLTSSINQRQLACLCIASRIRISRIVECSVLSTTGIGTITSTSVLPWVLCMAFVSANLVAAAGSSSTNSFSTYCHSVTGLAIYRGTPPSPISSRAAGNRPLLEFMGFNRP